MTSPLVDTWMPKSPLTQLMRSAEIARLIGLARTMLNRPEEEIVVNYLDHALEALQIVSEDINDATPPQRSHRPMTRPMAPAKDLG
jgi:hypothetical protein